MLSVFSELFELSELLELLELSELLELLELSDLVVVCLSLSLVLLLLLELGAVEFPVSERFLLLLSVFLLSLLEELSGFSVALVSEP